MQPINLAILPKNVASKIEVAGDADCWPWTGLITKQGYGQATVQQRHYLAHRLVYEALVEPIRPNMMIDHRCFNRSCVNPAHLRQVTNKQNMEHLRGPNRDSTSGVRNVYRHSRSGRWRVQIGHAGRQYSGGVFDTLAEAEAAAIALRARFFTHDDAAPPVDRPVQSA